MTTPDAPQTPKFADRAFRSPMGVVGGVIVLALGLWLGIDAVVRGTGRTPWTALACLLVGVPLVIAFALRPVVYAGDARLRVRNPLRTITIPWARVETIEARYSTEVVADGKKYQMWAIPVSMRARKRATRRTARADAGIAQGPPGVFGRSRAAEALQAGRRDADLGEPQLAPSDRTVEDLRELLRRNADNPEAQTAVTVRWAYELIAPAVLGVVAVLVLALT
jgi:Bacterial PH domain